MPIKKIVSHFILKYEDGIWRKNNIQNLNPILFTPNNALNNKIKCSIKYG
jgi:hypothetical protein